jgi:hypothetical protein
MWIRTSDRQPLMPWNLTEVSKHGEHDQKSHGSWAARGGVGGVIEGATAESLQQQMLAGGGISVAFTGKSPKDGFMVSYAGTETVVSDADMRDPTKGKEIIRDFLRQHAEKLQAGRGMRGRSVTIADQPKNYLGAWFNERTSKNPDGDNNWYLDISENVGTLTDAVRVGREREQLAIWSVNAETAINMDSPLADYAMTSEGGNPQGGSWFSPGSGRRSVESPSDAFKAANMEDNNE